MAITWRDIIIISDGVDLDELEEDNEFDYDEPDGDPDDGWGCEFGNRCLMPGYDHRRDECYTREMAEDWQQENTQQ